MAAYDIERIRASLRPLSAYLAADGHELRRAGSKYFIQCPWHAEKSGSCSVDDHRGRYHCFGCGARGDTIDYIAHSRGLSLADTLALLANENGITAPHHHTPRTPRPVFTEPPAQPLTSMQELEWRDSCQRLLFDNDQIQRIAAWRGIEPDAIRHLATEGLMGLHSYYSTHREAFAVQRPAAGKMETVSIHCRLAPGSKGNEQGGKASWRYAPSGCGAWPFVIGDITTAKYLFVNEGQWDSAALMSMMGWHTSWPKSTALIGLRGATSGAKLLLHPIHPRAVVFAFADSDNAGTKWFEPDGFLAQLALRVHRIHAYWPTSAKSDLNDIIKSGQITRDSTLIFIRAKLPRPSLRTSYPTFRQWLDAHAPPTALHHHAYAATTTAPYKPIGRAPIHQWNTLWQKHHDPATVTILHAAYTSYLQTR